MIDSLGSLSDLSHLHQIAQTTVYLPNPERMMRIRNERWIGYTRAHQALSKLEELFTFPKRQRMPNLLIIGPTNNGKSMIVEKFRRAHPSQPLENTMNEIIPVLVMQMPSDPSISRFYYLLLAAMNAPIRPRMRLVDLEPLSLKLLRATAVQMLVIDECHNMLAGSNSMQREFLNLVRFLGNELQIPIVCVGTREAYLAIRSDDQLENRFEPFILPTWQEGEELMSLLSSFAASFPLRYPSSVHQPELARYVLSRTEGTIGEISALLVRAAIAAIESGEEAINARTLALADYESPTERRKAFERQLR
jgi:Bacterial TniB protein